LPFICAVVISNWYGGLGPGLLATRLGACLASYAFLPPPWSWMLQGVTSLVYVALFLITGAVIRVVQAQLHCARQRAEAEAAERQAADEARREHERFIHRVAELSPVVLDISIS
jgi:two-component system sensor histidine kinase/response regulator